MASINITQPSSIVAAENPIVFNLSTGLKSGGANAYAKTRFNFTVEIPGNVTTNFRLKVTT